MKGPGDEKKLKVSLIGKQKVELRRLTISRDREGIECGSFKIRFGFPLISVCPLRVFISVRR